jgi:drug/metabolite transporter (DMT)-like permease
MQKDLEKMINAGQRQLKWICLGACTLTLINIGLGLVYDNYVGTTVQQVLVLGVTAALSILLFKGRHLRWYFFAWLLLAAFGLFFQGGQRMIYQTQDGGLGVYLSVLSGLGLIGSAIYLAGSEEIGVFLESLHKDEAKPS